MVATTIGILSLIYGLSFKPLICRWKFIKERKKYHIPLKQESEKERTIPQKI